MARLKEMTVEDAFRWVELGNVAFNNSPTTEGKPEEWIVRAGQLSRQMILNVPPELKRAVTDDDVRDSLDVEPEPEGSIL